MLVRSDGSLGNSRTGSGWEHQDDGRRDDRDEGTDAHATSFFPDPLNPFYSWRGESSTGAASLFDKCSDQLHICLWVVAGDPDYTLAIIAITGPEELRRSRALNTWRWHSWWRAATKGDGL
jgi:hypothetical protein